MIYRYIKINKIILKTNDNKKITYNTDYKMWSLNYWVDKWDILLSDILEEIQQEEQLMKKLKDFLKNIPNTNFITATIEDIDFVCLK